MDTFQYLLFLIPFPNSKRIYIWVKNTRGCRLGGKVNFYHPSVWEEKQLSIHVHECIQGTSRERSSVIFFSGTKMLGCEILQRSIVTRPQRLPSKLCSGKCWFSFESFSHFLLSVFKQHFMTLLQRSTAGYANCLALETASSLGEKKCLKLVDRF